MKNVCCQTLTVSNYIKPKGRGWWRGGGVVLVRLQVNQKRFGEVSPGEGGGGQGVVGVVAAGEQKWQF